MVLVIGYLFKIVKRNVGVFSPRKYIGMPVIKQAADTHSSVIQFTINSQSIDSNSVQFGTETRSHCTLT